jgi:hypothetical protein
LDSALKRTIPNNSPLKTGIEKMKRKPSLIFFTVEVLYPFDGSGLFFVKFKSSAMFVKR